MRTAIRGLLALVLLLLTALPAFADGPAVTMQAAAGFDGRAKPGKWVPVTLTLQNDGAEFEGVLQFESSSQLNPQASSTAVYRTPVVVPAGGTKQVTVLAPAEGMGVPTIDLMKGDEKIANVIPKVEHSFDLLVGVLGVEPAELAPIAGRPISETTKVHLVQLSPESMPAEALVLENLDTILLDRFSWTELPGPQRQAVQAWVEHGGTLIIAAGPEARRLEGIAPWVPLTIKGVEELSVEKVGKAPVAVADLPDSGDGAWNVTWRSGSTPLAARYQKGAGTVHFLAFDPALQPFAGWNGLPEFVHSLLPVPMLGNGMGPGPGQMKASYVLMDSVMQFPARTMPSTKGLLIILGLYALLIGPVHFLLLRGFRRLGWALLTLPILAGLGAGGAWAYAEKARGSDVFVNSVAIIEGQAGGTSLRVSQLAGVMMPPGSGHALSQGDALLSPMAVPYYGGPGAPMAPPSTKTILDLGRTAQLEPLEQWALRAVAAESIVPSGGSVTGALTLEEMRAKGRLTSELPFALKDAIVVSGGNFQRIGDLKPGDAVDVSLMLPAFAQQFGGPNTLVEAIGRAYQFNGWGPEGPTAEQMEQMRRQQMAWAGAQSVSWINSSRRPPAVLVGWTNQQPLDLQVDGRTISNQGMAMYVQPLTVSYSSEKFALPAGFLSPRMVGGSFMQGQELYPGWSMPKGNDAVMEFTVPAGLVSRVTDLELKAPTMGKGPSGRYPLVFSFYRWSDGTWQEVGLEGEGANPTSDREFLRDDGTVRIRMTWVLEEQMPMATPGLAVTGGGVR